MEKGCRTLPVCRRTPEVGCRPSGKRCRSFQHDADRWRNGAERSGSAATRSGQDTPSPEGCLNLAGGNAPDAPRTTPHPRGVPERRPPSTTAIPPLSAAPAGAVTHSGRKPGVLPPAKFRQPSGLAEPTTDRPPVPTVPGLKAQPMTAWGEAPGILPRIEPSAVSASPPSHHAARTGKCRAYSPETFWNRITWGCAHDVRSTSGCHRTGFQPCAGMPMSPARRWTMWMLKQATKRLPSPSEAEGQGEGENVEV